MDAIINIIRNLIFGAVGISIIEVLVPEGHFKKHFNYVGGVIFLAIMAGSFWDIKDRQEEIFRGFSSLDAPAKDVTNKIEKRQNVYFEKALRESIQNGIEDYLKQNYNLSEVHAMVTLSVSEDTKNIDIHEARVAVSDTPKLDAAFYEFMKNNFNLKKESIFIDAVRR